MTKKGFKVTGLALGLLMVLLAPIAWAANVTTGTGNVTIGSTPVAMTFQTSPSVNMAYRDASAGATYTAGAVNSKGTIIYGVDSDFTGVYYQVTTLGDSTPGIPAPTSGSTGEFGTGWSTLGG